MNEIPDLMIYCDACNRISPCIIDPLKKDKYNSYAMGEIVCGNCNTVINVLTSQYEGKIIFEKETNG